jgi:hypothetical protein
MKRDYEIGGRSEENSLGLKGLYWKANPPYNFLAKKCQRFYLCLNNFSCGFLLSRSQPQ